MLEGYSPVTQALLGTLFTWGLTAAGAALVFIFSSRQKRILDGSLGFAAGVMLAASYWSLLAPAIDMAEDSGKYGSFAFVPVAVGFTLGAAFVYFADLAMPFLVGTLTHTVFYVSWRAQKILLDLLKLKLNLTLPNYHVRRPAVLDLWASFPYKRGP
uniref:Zinc transporter ZIP11-like n=1 Tax=Haplochromis burtoni TaxID=8153 RepID=A0A3Q2VT15_HAPBU